MGPYLQLEDCPECGEARYTISGRKKIPRAVFNTIPVGPQLQALRRHPDTAWKMRYHAERTEALFDELRQNDGLVKSYNDVFSGEAYLNAVQQGKIGPNNMLLMFLIDGAQLFESKESDCWIYIWVILDLPPDCRYKKSFVLPGVVKMLKWLGGLRV